LIIKKVEITKFRGFKDVEFTLGKYLTFITGLNGTQKTTLLGMLSQPFTISEKDHPLIDEIPLCGGNYKSAFADKFRLSTQYDKASEHEWTLHFLTQEEPFTVESISRDKHKGTIRFWQKGKRTKGSGYIQLPVIYLSLKRLLPIGEDKNLKQSDQVTLDQEEQKLFIGWYKKILITQDNIDRVEYLNSTNKDTMGVSADTYDWNSNSAGQDNISKLLLAILSFRRLKRKFPEVYQGGILAIDEIDATLYPGAQIKLIEFLIKFCSKFDIQILATSHSLSMIESVYEIAKEPKREGQCKVVFLQKIDGEVEVNKDITFKGILNKLSVSIDKKVVQKFNVFTEDDECREFAQAILGRKFPKLNFIKKCKLGCDTLLELNRQHVPDFIFPNSIVILDGDAEKSKRLRGKTNFIVLPGSDSPERELALFLNQLSDRDPFWTSVNPDYDKLVCFKDISLEDITAPKSRVKAKEWYNAQKESGAWGRAAAKLYSRWLEDKHKEKAIFIQKFVVMYNKIVAAKGL
jgi:predicted ATPase